MASVLINDNFTLEIYPEDIDIGFKDEPVEIIEIEDDDEDEPQAYDDDVIVIEDDEPRAPPQNLGLKLNGGSIIATSASDKPPASVLKRSLNGVFRCHLCVYMTNDCDYMIRHWDGQHDIETFKCLECEDAFHTIEHLDRHFRMLHDIGAPERPKQPRKTIMVEALPKPARRTSLKTAKPKKVTASKTKTKVNKNVKKTSTVPNPVSNSPRGVKDLLREQKIKKRVAHRPKDVPDAEKQPCRHDNPSKKTKTPIKILNNVVIKPPPPALIPLVALHNQSPFTENPWEVRAQPIRREERDDDSPDRLVIDEDFQAAVGVSTTDQSQSTDEEPPPRYIPIYSPNRKSYRWVEVTFETLRRLRPSHVPNDQSCVINVGMTDNENQAITVKIPPDPPNYRTDQ